MQSESRKIKIDKKMNESKQKKKPLELAQPEKTEIEIKIERVAQSYTKFN